MTGADEPKAAQSAIPDVSPAIPAAVERLLDRLWTSGHAAYVVGGSIRDALLGRDPSDWDLATDARPERIVELFPGAVYENRFGTVVVREGRETFEITTFRSDHEYLDFRRPAEVVFGDSIEVDLARRDFTVNAVAWGATAVAAGAARAAPGPVDPFGGRADLAAAILRAVGEPGARFREDALRVVRAVRLAATLGFEIEPATLAGMRETAPLVRHLSGERVGAELDKLLGAPRPSIGFRLMAETGILGHLFPELDAQRGIPQDKAAGGDLWDHVLRSVDAVPAERPVVRLAALLHDIGKPPTMADGHFHRHDAVGADMATALLARLRTPRLVTERVAHLVRHHMFTYAPSWGDAGVRRFIRRVGPSAIGELFELRAADNAGSGLGPDAHGLTELRERVAAELAAAVALERGDLAIDGNDLIRELGLPPGPILGRILDVLLERVLTDPAANDRPTLLMLAAAMLADEP